jgi:hypothetical protein
MIEVGESVRVHFKSVGYHVLSNRNVRLLCKEISTTKREKENQATKIAMSK